MRASVDKHRDIARSILPSKNRKPARASIARAKRSARHHVRTDLRGLTRALGADRDAWLDHGIDCFDTSDHAVRSLVYQRRQGDKLNHFERWAVMRTRSMPIEDRIPYLRTTLPDGLVGGHAMSHLQDIPHLTGRPRYAWHLRYAIEHRRYIEAVIRFRRQIRAALLDALEFGDHADLNRALRHRAALAGVAHLPIGSAADVERWLTAIGHTIPHLQRTAVQNCLVRALDDVVDGWRLLTPGAGPADPVVEVSARRQSWATGLSWLPPFNPE